MPRTDDNPFFTRAPSLPGQAEIPISTVHLCPACGSNYLCDVEDCGLEFRRPCATCSGIAEPHSQHVWNLAPLPEIERPPIPSIRQQRQRALFAAPQEPSEK